MVRIACNVKYDILGYNVVFSILDKKLKNIILIPITLFNLPYCIIYLTEYVKTIMKEVEAQCQQVVGDRDVLVDDQPPPLCHGVVRPQKQQAVALVQRRFAGP